MKLRNKINGGLAEVSDEYGKVLIASGAWEGLEGLYAPKHAAPKATPRQAKKAAPGPTQAPKDAIAE